MLAAAIRKDIALLLRDTGALASLFLLPIIFVAVFGAMFGGESGEPRRLAVYAAPDNALAEKVAAAIDESGAFRVEPQESAEEVRRLVAEEERSVGLVLSSSFQPAAGVPAELVIDEARSPQFRGPLEGSLSGIIARVLIGRELPVMIEARTPPGLTSPMRDVGGFQISVPGNAVLFGFFLALTMALSFTEERKSGTFRRILAAPVRRPVILLAKLVPYVFVGAAQMALLFGVGALIFGMRVGGSFLGLIALTLAVVICAVCLGLLIASFSGTEKQIGGIGSICILVMGMLGGAMIPRLIMPESMQAIGLVTPHAWALEGYYDLLVREGAGLLDVLPEIGAVLAFAMAFAAVGAARFKFER